MLSTTHAQLAPNTIFARDFRILWQLDAGGMGAVYVAEQISTSAQRALKVMHPELVRDARSRERFAQEARIGARIESDHVVQVLGAGIDEATELPWIAMELLKGETLSAAVKRRGAIPAPEALEIFRQLGHALGRAHAVGLVHRDVKPENVFLAIARRQGSEWTVKLLDFGIAKVIQESVNLTGAHALGSPLWMAPEQGGGGTITPATDVYALGLLAFFVLTGTYYWRAATDPRSDARALLLEAIAGPTELALARAAALGCRAQLPPAFDAWFACCTAREPSQRFPNADMAVAALAQVLSASVAPMLVASARPVQSAVALPHYAQPSHHLPPQGPTVAGPHAFTAPTSTAEAFDAQLSNFGTARTQASHSSPMFSALSNAQQPHAQAPHGHAPAAALPYAYAPSTAPPVTAPPAIPRTMFMDAASLPAGAIHSPAAMHHGNASPTAHSGAYTPAPQPAPRATPAWLYVLAGAGIAALVVFGVALGKRLSSHASESSTRPSATPPAQPAPPALPQPSSLAQAPTPVQPATMQSPPVQPAPPAPVAQQTAVTPPAMVQPAPPAPVAQQTAVTPPAPPAPPMQSPPVAAPARPRVLMVRSRGGGPIYDDHTTSAIALVEQPCVVQRLEVIVRGSHTFYSDMVVWLRSPNGETMVLQNHSDANPFRRYSGTRFVGQQAMGSWTLSITDDVSQDSGVLSGFALALVCR